MSVIEVRKLTKRFGPPATGDHLSFEVDGGTVVGFLALTGRARSRLIAVLTPRRRWSADGGLIPGKDIAAGIT